MLLLNKYTINHGVSVGHWSFYKVAAYNLSKYDIACTQVAFLPHNTSGIEKMSLMHDKRRPNEWRAYVSKQVNFSIKLHNPKIP